MNAAASVARYVGLHFLPAAGIITLAIALLSFWALSGAGYALKAFNVARFLRTLALGYDRVGRTRVALAMTAQAVVPFAGFRTAEVEWLRTLQKRYVKSLEEAGDPTLFVDDVLDDSHTAQLVASRMAADGDPTAVAALDRYRDRIDASIEALTDRVFEAEDIAHIRVLWRPRLRLVVDLLLLLTRQREAIAYGRRAGIMLTDAIGRFSALGIFAGAIYPSHGNVMDKVAIGSLVGGTVGILLWQRNIVRRFASVTADTTPRGPTPVARWVMTYPGLTLSLFYLLQLGLTVGPQRLNMLVSHLTADWIR